ncbi:MAG: hypothetical protein NTY09_06525 [bacterium]|nr:hypothetical protein [bacterium]
MAGMAKFSSFKDSYSWALYERAIGRIWSGKFIFIVWGLLWSAAAAYFAFWLFDFIPFSRKLFLFVLNLSEYGFLAITPIIVGWALSRAYVFEGRADSSLKTVPLRPYQALMPRMIAVFLTWVEFALPFAIVFLLVICGMSRHIATNQLPASISSDIPDFRIMLIESLIFMGVEFNGYGLIEMFPVSTDALPLLYSIIFIEVLGYCLLPISWGFWWGTKLKQRAGQFILAYIAYALLPATFYGIVISNSAIRDLFKTNISGLALALLVNPGWLVLSIIFTFLAFREWGRRSE